MLCCCVSGDTYEHSFNGNFSSLAAHDPNHFNNCRHSHHNEHNANDKADSCEDFVFISCAATQSETDATEHAEQQGDALVLEFFENGIDRLTPTG